ncbi:MAG: T9SS type A sorting domain-containing protein [Bacteroidia bacterium]|nr:T9SS type A sorting domain-containing protein [Bacteroidia bacterium]
MKFYSTFIFLCLIQFSIQAQIAIEWSKTFGGSGSDNAHKAINTDDGGFAFIGRTGSSVINGVSCSGSAPTVLIKTNSAGIVQWTTCLSTSIGTFERFLAQTADHGFVILFQTTYSSGMRVTKLDSIGNIEWSVLHGSYIGTDIHQTPDLGYIIAGYTPSGSCRSGGYSKDYLLMKINSSGTFMWNKCYGYSGFSSTIDQAYSIALTPDGGFMLAGISEGGDPWIGYHGGFDCHVIKTDSVGTFEWERFYGGSGDEEIYSIKTTSDGGYIIGGVASSSDGDISGLHSSKDLWIFKIDSVGTLQWQKCLGGYNGERGFDVIETNDGNYMIAGYVIYDSYNPAPQLNYLGGKDFYVAKLDGNGELIYEKTLGGSNNEIAYSILNTTDNGYVVIGESLSKNGDVPNTYTNNDFWAVKFKDAYNSITGSMFIDINGNNVKDTSEFPIAQHKVFESGSGNICFTDSNGEFKIYLLDSGNFTMIPDPLNYYNAVPAFHAATFTGTNQKDSLNNFAFQPSGPINDLCISITPLGNFRSGFQSAYMINYINVGTTDLTPTIIFKKDPNLTINNSIPTGNIITTDSIMWTPGLLKPFQSGSIIVNVQIQSGISIGTLINSSASIEPIAGDNNPGCNVAYWELFTTGSYDPNDIIVNRTQLHPNEFPNPPYLEYIIRFQNTGNDTAFFVYLKNNISTLLDINTFEIVASSHYLASEYNPFSRLMSFRFDNILLPDDNVNEPASHGFVRYRIKPLDTLQLGDVIKNFASIYFDFNLPIVTNTAQTTVVIPTNLSEIDALANWWGVYPNPANSNLNVIIDTRNVKNIKIELQNIVGQRLSEIFQSDLLTEKTTVAKNIEDLPKGIYFIKLTSDSGTEMKKFIKL